MMIRRSLFEQIGGFNKSFASSELLQDADLCLKALRKKFFVNFTREPAGYVDKAQPAFGRVSAGSQVVQDFSSTHSSTLVSMVDPYKSSLSVVWDLFCGCTGLNIEAASFLEPLDSMLPIGVIAGENCFCPGFPTSTSATLHRIRERFPSLKESIDVFISHKPPTHFPSFPYQGIVKIENRPRFVVGRSMSESTPIPDEWVKSCNSGKVDEIWIPSEWHRSVFSESGVHPAKLFVIPEPINVHLYNPALTDALPIPSLAQSFNFLSVFKMEPRKGWDLLLTAYCNEFSAEDNVTLYLQTYLYGDSDPHNRNKIVSQVTKFTTALKLNKTLPRIEVLSLELPVADMPRLYKAFDAFVLATHGEGWGLPIMEAMAMGLPTISTDWSGQTEFMTPENSWPIPVESLVPVNPSAAKGNKTEMWAKNWRNFELQPNVAEISSAMRYVFNYPVLARKRGAKARSDVVHKFSQDAVATLVFDRLREIEAILPSRQNKSSKGRGFLPKT